MNVRRSIIFLTIFLFSLLAGPSARTTAGFDAPRAKVLLDNADIAAVQSLVISGGERLVDYGEFSLWSLPTDPTPHGPALYADRTSGYAPLDENIYLRSAVITADQKSAALRLGESSAPQTISPESEGLWIVQFIGPVLPEWEQALGEAGLQAAGYLPNYAYLVWGSQPSAAIEAVAARTQAVQWSGPYDPAYRLAPALQEAQGETQVDVTVQVVNTPHLASTLETITAQAAQIYQVPDALLDTTRVSVQVRAQQLLELASLPDVINIEPYQPPEMLDEIQGQSMAGLLTNINGALIAARPGYLEWLEQKGFPKDPAAYPLVEVIDDGIDTGFVDNILHPDFYILGKRQNFSRIAAIRNCSKDPGGNSAAGHGNLNAGILGGYNNSAGSPYQDALGFQRGLGISPYGRIAATKIFDSLGLFNMERCKGGIASIIPDTYAGGTRITSNSWGRQTYAEYDTEAMQFDVLTRDASPEPGDQSMLHVFAAGNAGKTFGPLSISSPATAKNVLSVGAAENARDHNISDRCLVSNSDSFDDVADFSSIGPTAGGRAKPDILAPGTHVQGPASQDPAFNGSQVCGSMESKYYPTGQSLYTWSSGTSHAAPAVSGAAQLIHNYYARVFAPGREPSPAMVKALILNTPRYMTGTFAGDTLPSPYQGWGSVDMGNIFDDTPRELVDQEIVFDRSGSAYTIDLHRMRADLPVRVSLVWTDAPGNPVAARALVNDLDLEVTFQGQVHRGNAFDGAFSVVGGEADHLNNVENVFLPAGQGSSFQVRVIARNIAGDGLPNRSGTTDQDFALVIYNGQDGSQPANHLLWFPLIGGGRR